MKGFDVIMSDDTISKIGFYKVNDDTCRKVKQEQ